MARGDAWSSGNWQVREGAADEFLKRWDEFAHWIKDRVPGFEHGRLLRDVNDPNHFVSIAGWEDAKSRADWMEMPEFADFLNTCKELCDDFRPGMFEEVVSV